jgi:hypothetical protein
MGGAHGCDPWAGPPDLHLGDRRERCGLTAGLPDAEQDRCAALPTDKPRIEEGMCSMDVITQIRLLWLGGLGALYGVALSTVWLLGGLIHRREQRRSRLLESVRRQFPVELRDQIAIQICGAMFGGRAVITIDMGRHAPESWWSTMTDLSQNLSPNVRLLVCSTDARPFPVTLTIKPGRQRGTPSCRVPSAA